MEYSIGVYDMPEEMALKVRMNDLLYRMSQDRWEIKWVGTSYRGTKLIIIFERKLSACAHLNREGMASLFLGNHVVIQGKSISNTYWPNWSYGGNGDKMNAALITAIAAGAVSIIGAVTALIQAFKNKNAIQNHIASHSEDKPIQ